MYFATTTNLYFSHKELFDGSVLWNKNYLHDSENAEWGYPVHLGNTGIDLKLQKIFAESSDINY